MRQSRICVELALDLWVFETLWVEHFTLKSQNHMLMIMTFVSPRIIGQGQAERPRKIPPGQLNLIEGTSCFEPGSASSSFRFVLGLYEA